MLLPRGRLPEKLSAENAHAESFAMSEARLGPLKGSTYDESAMFGIAVWLVDRVNSSALPGSAQRCTVKP